MGNPLFFRLVSAWGENGIFDFAAPRSQWITDGSQGNNSRQEPRGRTLVEAACWLPLLLNIFFYMGQLHKNGINSIWPGTTFWSIKRKCPTDFSICQSVDKNSNRAPLETNTLVHIFFDFSCYIIFFSFILLTMILNLYLFYYYSREMRNIVK